MMSEEVQFYEWLVCSWALIQALELDRLDAMAALNGVSLKSHITLGYKVVSQCFLSVKVSWKE